jgi:hypothetical protein
MNYDPDKDGIDHLNVYSKAKTKLGRDLSNFSHYPIIHPELGSFASIEGLWYWLTRQDDRLRELSGFQAKELGKSLPKVKSYPEAEFQRLVVLGLNAKLNTYPDLKGAVQACPLRFTHYYVYHFGGEQKVVPTKDNEWILAVYEQARLDVAPGSDRFNLDWVKPVAPAVEEPQLGLF